MKNILKIVIEEGLLIHPFNVLNFSNLFVIIRISIGHTTIFYVDCICVVLAISEPNES